MTAPATVQLTDLIAEEVRALLGRRRMSASTLARQMGVTQRYVSRRLTGDAPFDANDLQRIAGTLGVPVRALLPDSVDDVQAITESGREVTTRYAAKRAPVTNRPSSSRPANRDDARRPNRLWSALVAA